MIDRLPAGDSLVIDACSVAARFHPPGPSAIR
jgi:hypothetical protein